MCTRPMAVRRDEVEAAVNSSVGNDTAIDTRLCVHVFLIMQINVVNERFPATTAMSGFTGHHWSTDNHMTEE